MKLNIILVWDQALQYGPEVRKVIFWLDRIDYDDFPNIYGWWLEKKNNRDEGRVDIGLSRIEINIGG